MLHGKIDGLDSEEGVAKQPVLPEQSLLQTIMLAKRMSVAKLSLVERLGVARRDWHTNVQCVVGT